MGGIPAGWHIDPDDPTLLRYWDGEQWTEHRQPRRDETVAAASDPTPARRPPVGTHGYTPGWYPDQGRPGWVRYWDGQAWTDSAQREERLQPPSKRPWYGGPLRLILLGSLGILVIIALATSGGDGGSGDPGGATGGNTDRYTQTWTKPYSSTTCNEWLGSMTGQQRFAAAADMLTRARNTGDGGTGLPPDSLILSFQSDVSEACSAQGSMSVAEVGASVYLIGRSMYMP